MVQVKQAQAQVRSPLVQVPQQQVQGHHQKQVQGNPRILLLQASLHPQHLQHLCRLLLLLLLHALSLQLSRLLPQPHLVLSQPPLLLLLLPPLPLPLLLPLPLPLPPPWL